MSQPGTPIIPQPQPAPVGLINSAPGMSTTTPGATPPGSPGPGAPVTSYTPSAAKAASYDPTAFAVPDNAKVASQIRDIIASGSPLMQQAETSAKNMMAQRGLINSSQAITAGQSAVYGAATPIATADAGTFAQAARDTAAAENAAKAANAGAQTQTSQFNSGQTNASLSQAAQASNTEALTGQQIAGQTNIQQMQSDTSKQIAAIQRDTTLSAQDKQDQTNLAIQNNQSALSKYLGELQSSTSLTSQQMASEAQKAIADANNVSAKVIAGIQSDTSLSIEQQQTRSAQVLAAMNNENAQTVQKIQNAGNLANIQADGTIKTQIEQMTEQNRDLLQTSQGAAGIYSQMLQNFSAIIGNKDLSQEQKTAALNDGVQQLNDALAVMGQIANIPGLQSTLNFSNDNVPAAAADTSTGTGLINSDAAAA